MMSKNTNSLDIVNGPLLENILRFVWPIMLANVLQITFHFADTLVIGNFVSDKALAAVGTTGPITIFFMWGLLGLSSGANIKISRMIGAKENESIRHAVFTAMCIGLLSGIIVSLFGLIMARYFLLWLSTPEDIINDSLLYLRIYFLCGTAIALYDFGTAVLRASGDSKRPTLYLGISGVLNVFLNLVFVVAFKWNVAGVAFATLISQSFSALLVINRLLKNDDLISLKIDKDLFDKDLAKQILRYGIPSALQNQMFSFSNMIIQSSINSFGSTFVAANTAANAIEEYVYVFVDAFPQAALTFTSQLYGAKKIKRISQMILETFFICGIGAFIIGMSILNNGRFFLSLVSDDPKVIEMGLYRFRYVTAYLFLNGLLDVVVNSLRGMGLSVLPTIITLFGVCGIRIFFIYTYFANNPSIPVLYMCFPLSWFVTLIIQSGIWIFIYQKTLEENNQRFSDNL